MTPVVAVIDSGGYNLTSLCCAFERLGAQTVITRGHRDLDRASHWVLPGVGHAGRALDILETAGLSTTIRETRKPLLGICVGMQVLTAWCEEGNRAGLGILDGRSIRLPDRLRVPQIGWNDLRITTDSPLFSGLRNNRCVYYVHAYYTPSSADRTAESDYEDITLTAAVSRDNVHGCQFHPERSADHGAAVLANFLATTRSA